MTTSEIPPELEITFPVISHKIRDLIVAADSEPKINIVLNMLAEFTRSDRIAFIELDQKQVSTSGKVVGLLRRGQTTYPNNSIRIDVPPFKDVIETNEHGVFRMANGSSCLSLPLIGVHDQVFGIIIIDQETEVPPSEQEMQTLIVLTSLLTLSLEYTSHPQATAFDKLTGFYTQDHLVLRLREEMARTKRQGSQLSVVVAEVDHFKHLNDTYGYQQGDIILRELAKIIRYSIRKDVDLPYYIHRGRFVTLLPNTSQKGAGVVAERIRENCEYYPFPCQDETLKLTISIGISGIGPDSEVSQEQFLERGDKMLEKAKESGHNHVMVWE